ncbi:substrate-binding domain-containing protein [Arthrobacter sp. M2012083]|uniref:substrate-binding domain-containing protein n=1 Tax=Arthrobacter sp. M2012083 TaxID=1197706 RepID=UPI00030420D2|nr:substrate-binding domain-containing protein [Arthrobacter sp. M2012083]
MTARTQRRGLTVKAAAFIAAAGLTATLAACSSSAADSKPLVGLITKTDDNPYYVKMREGAEKKAAELGFELQSLSGQGQSDNDSQVKAIENLVARGAKGIMIAPSDSEAILPAIKKARDAGVFVAVLDSPTNPTDAADATFATDNFQAGVLIGQWAKAQFANKPAKIAMLDLSPAQVAVDVQRNQGFLQGFGVDVADKNKIGDEKDPRIVGHEVTNANEAGGRAAMEKLLQRDRTINLVYTINEPAAAGAYSSIKAAGLDGQVTVVSIDGGCPGVNDVKAGAIGATSMQFPIKMATDALQAINAYLKDGTKPSTTEGLDFTNTGVTLITDQAAPGVTSEPTSWGLENCWG